MHILTRIILCFILSISTGNKEEYQDIFLQVFTSTHVGVSPALVRVQDLRLLWIFCDMANRFSCRDFFSTCLPQDAERVWCHHCPDHPTKNGKHAKMLNTHAQMSAPDQDFSPALMFFWLFFFFLWRRKHLLLSAKVISAGFEQQQHSSFWYAALVYVFW